MSKTPSHIEAYIDKCVRCGSCKAQCPTYALSAIEPLGARGRVVLVGALVKGEIQPTQKLISRLSSCLLCGICEPSCPVGVGITDVVYHGLGLIAQRDKGRSNLRRAMGFATRHPLTSFKSAKLLRPLLPLLRKLGILPVDIALPDTPLSVGLEIFKPEKPIGRVAIFMGCAVNYMRPNLGSSLIKILFDLGYEVVLPAGEVCCGAPLRSLGMHEQAEALARKNMEAFGRLKAEAILSLCPTCTLAVKKQYPHTIGEGLENAMDATEFLAEKLKGTGVGASEDLKGKRFVYHAPCHLMHGLGVKDAPLEMLRSLGLEADKPATHNCCGFSQNMYDRSVADKLAAQRAEAFKGYDTVVTACPGCMDQLGRVHGRVVHAIEIIKTDQADVIRLPDKL